ncbi:hypothetical protein GHT07_09075 [Caenimonas koreensis DSM 17982]|uniref:Uncharacterized protein n=1 Tax=Caenimonas koreensis DSM 17982 TaxID=1121255 RepID=A0A844AYE2_9BURK|nr:hypothetical protein [Caenimonas koreensis]MRD47428.1 hypothetical protein [Caenimonas koreensis DSM 17982]
MNVLYYWKNFEADLKAGRLGYFKADAGKMQALLDGYPDYIWVLKTPKGRKGEVQVLARLKWLDKAPPGVKPEPGRVYMHYDFKDDKSIQFTDSDSEEAIAATTKWVGLHFPRMVSANFQGAQGQEELRGGALKELEQIASGWQHTAFRELVA